MTVFIAIPAVFIASAAGVFGCRLERRCAFYAAAHFEHSVHFAVITGVRLLANILHHSRKLLVEREHRRQRAAKGKKFSELENARLYNEQKQIFRPTNSYFFSPSIVSISSAVIGFCSREHIALATRRKSS